MISAEQLRDCRDVHGLQRLLCSIGYPAEARPIDLGHWRRAGLDVEPPDDPGTLYHLCRTGTIDLFASVNGTADHIERLLRALHSRNPLRKQVFFQLDGETSISMIDLGRGRRLRRLRSRIDDPRPHDIERWSMIELREGEGAIDSIFDRALDREQITREFFRRFRDARTRLGEALHSAEPDEAESEARAEALLILSRILFLYFIQEKGWLNGERCFLADRLRGSRAAGNEFFSSVMVPLFFGCLNTPARSRSAKALALGRIPYLNGGLFEPSAWEKRHPAISLPNELMVSAIEELFERFSFSVEESEEDNALVDPEMLGKVFESLMEADDRRATGSFYTPREIVDVLTREAIGRAFGAEEQISTLSPQRAGEMLEQLRSIRVLDPACGSGAFLLAALREVEGRIVRLSEIAGEPLDPSLRQRLVEGSLYGVDLKPEAVRLCELRLWLAIVAQSRKEIEDVPPLPNLDRNILQGNSLLSPLDFLGDGRVAIYRDWSSALRERLRDLVRYRSATSAHKSRIYRSLRESDRQLALALLGRAIEADRAELEQIRSQVSLAGTERRESEGESALRERVLRLAAESAAIERGALSFFSFEVHFANVMAEGGFDVVLGNPPWVRSSRIDANDRRMYAERYAFFRGGGRGFRQSDLSLAFFERSLNLTRQGGVLALLMPAKLLNAHYATRLREEILAEHEILSLRDWSDEPKRLFEADTFPLGIILRRSGRMSEVLIHAAGQSTPVRQQALASGSEGAWSLVPEEIRFLIEELRARHEPLAAAIGRVPVMGIKTGANERFFPGEVEMRGRYAYLRAAGVEVPVEALCRCVRGRSIRRWRSRWSEWMLWPERNGWRGDLPWVAGLASALKCDPSDFRLAFVRPEHLGTKVVWKDVSKGLQAVALPDSTEAEGVRFPLVPNQTAYFIDTADLEEAYVLSAILNSTMFNALALTVAERAKDAHFRYFGMMVGGVPSPRILRGTAAWHSLARLARRAHTGADVEDELDRIVSGLYGISAAEASRVERFVKCRLRLS